jgi:tetratricopeptide (TPR) repeat protein
MSKLPPEESDILLVAVDRFFHLYGYNKERIELGKLEIIPNVKEKKREKNIIVEQAITNQVGNLIDRLGWANYLMNNKESAIENITQGVELAKKNSIFYLAAKGERHLAGIERHHGNTTAFFDHLSKSKEYTRQIQDDKERIEMEGSLHLVEAKFLLDQKDDLLKAEEEAKKAIYLFSNDPQRQVKVYSVLGNIYLEREDWDQAYEMFFKGYTKSENIRADERAKNAMGLAKIHLDPDIPRFYTKDKAKEYLLEAESLMNSLKLHEKNELESLMKAVE